MQPRYLSDYSKTTVIYHDCPVGIAGAYATIPPSAPVPPESLLEQARGGGPIYMRQKSDSDFYCEFVEGRHVVLIDVAPTYAELKRTLRLCASLAVIYSNELPPQRSIVLFQLYCAQMEVVASASSPPAAVQKARRMVELVDVLEKNGAFTEEEAREFGALDFKERYESPVATVIQAREECAGSVAWAWAQRGRPVPEALRLINGLSKSDPPATLEMQIKMQGMAALRPEMTLAKLAEIVENGILQSVLDQASDLVDEVNAAATALVLAAPATPIVLRVAERGSGETELIRILMAPASAAPLVGNPRLVLERALAMKRAEGVAALVVWSPVDEGTFDAVATAATARVAAIIAHLEQAINPIRTSYNRVEFQGRWEDFKGTCSNPACTANHFHQ